jgi:hypothetical protein
MGSGRRPRRIGPDRRRRGAEQQEDTGGGFVLRKHLKGPDHANDRRSRFAVDQRDLSGGGLRRPAGPNLVRLRHDLLHLLLNGRVGFCQASGDGIAPRSDLLQQLPLGRVCCFRINKANLVKKLSRVARCDAKVIVRHFKKGQSNKIASSADAILPGECLHFLAQA